MARRAQWVLWWVPVAAAFTATVAGRAVADGAETGPVLRAVATLQSVKTPPVRAEAVEPALPTTEPAVMPMPVAPSAPGGGEVREIFFGPRAERKIALTFDDGPSRENTPWILQTLREHDVKASFFVLGPRARKMPDLLERIDDAGHEVANHGWSHTSMRSLWPEHIRDELAHTSAAVEDAIGKRPAMFRPPFGRYPPSSVRLVGNAQMDIVLWSIDSHDWESDDPEVVADSVVDSAEPGGIVLLHDRKPVTAEALPAIIEGLRRRGYEIVPVSELLGLDPYVKAPPAATPGDL